MSSITTFQAVVLGIFFFFIVIGVVIFAGVGGNDQPTLPPLTIWGVVDERTFNGLLATFNIATQVNAPSVTYVQKSPASLGGELINAIASGKAPHLVLLPHDLLLSQRDKLLLIPEATLSARTLKDTFAQEGELFLAQGGTYGIPFSVDPLVMYWNRDLLFGAGAGNPPSTWDEMVALAPSLSVSDSGGTIRKSAAPLGGFSNYANAKGLLSALFFQVGTPIIASMPDGSVSIALDTQSPDGLASSDSALRFYTDFANPTKTTYSWNRSLPEARRAFVSNFLVFYFGFASEYQELKAENPNLNFDVARLPQIKGASAPVTYGKLTGIVIPAGAENQTYAAGLVSLAGLLISPDFEKAFGEAFSIPPARRDILGDTPPDAASAVFYSSGLISRGWLDPNPQASQAIFKSMVESVTSGQDTVRQAILSGQKELSGLFAQ